MRCGPQTLWRVDVPTGQQAVAIHNARPPGPLVREETVLSYVSVFLVSILKKKNSLKENGKKGKYQLSCETHSFWHLEEIHHSQSRRRISSQSSLTTGGKVPSTVSQPRTSPLAKAKHTWCKHSELGAIQPFLKTDSNPQKAGFGVPGPGITLYRGARAQRSLWSHDKVTCSNSMASHMLFPSFPPSCPHTPVVRGPCAWTLPLLLSSTPLCRDEPQS